MPSDSSYNEAKALLQRCYGDSFSMANTFRDKLEAWPRIANRDSVGLQRFADFLRQCLGTMRLNGSLAVLDDDRENKRLLSKLPDWLIPKWAQLVANHKEKHQEFPKFETFVKFLERESDIACDPVTSIQAVRPQNSERVRSTTNRNSGQAARSFATTLNSCLQCGKNHHIDDCSIFLGKTLETRKKYASDQRLCFGCLNTGHRSKDCRTRRKCKTCNKPHPTALHGDRPQSSAPKTNQTASTSSSDASPPTEGQHPQQPAEGQSSQPPTEIKVHLAQKGGTNKCSMIVPVWLSRIDKPDKETLVYALLDSQSDSSFVLEKTKEELSLDGTAVTLSLSTMSTQAELVQSQLVEGLRIRGFSEDEYVPLPALYTRDIMPANRAHIPTAKMADHWPNLCPMTKHLMPISDCDIALLIGYDCPHALAPTEVIPPLGQGPFTQKTALGWGIVGVIDHNINNDQIGASHQVLQTTSSSVLAFRTQVKEVPDTQVILRALERDFSEHSSSDAKMSQKDLKFIQIMERNIKQLPDGYYQMSLPFDVTESPLPNNRPAAVSRLQHLKKWFQRSSEFQNQYSDTVNKMITMGYAEVVPLEELNKKPGEPLWYLPHHGVFHPKKPEKLRVVFDGSATYAGQSLNSHLLQGPDQNNNLLGVLCRFRKEKVAFMCDIEAMFHHFKVEPVHRDYLRFLWWPDGTLNSEPVEYRMNAHLFGASSSPACANFALKTVADDHEHEHGQEAADFIRRDFYVDDGLKSVPTEAEAIQLAKNTRDLCARGNLHLHKFSSNSRALLQSIPADDRATSLRDLDILDETLPAERALGVAWYTESDSLQYRPSLPEQPVTRRGSLSTVCSIFDPLGLIAPGTLKGKQILQDICRNGSGWDEEIEESIQHRYQEWRDELNSMNAMCINQCFKPDDFGPLVRVELHSFSDASTQGYGQCS